MTHEDPPEGPGPNPYQHPPGPYDTRSAHAPPASKAMAGWALGLSLAFCVPFAFVVAIGLGIAVLVKGHDGRDHGKAMAIAALVIASLVFVANVALGVGIAVNGFGSGSDQGNRDQQGQITDSAAISTDHLRVGDCFDDQVVADAPADSTEIDATGEVLAVPCAEPHQFETFHIVEVTTDEFPGEDGIHEHAGRCVDAWEGYVGTPYRSDGAHELAYYYPTSVSWRLGDRTIVCNLYARDESMLTGSVREQP